MTEQFVRRKAYTGPWPSATGCRVVPEAFASGNAGKPIRRPRQVIPKEAPSPMYLL